MAKAISRTEIGDFQYLLQRARGAHDLAEDGAHGLRWEGALVLVVDVQDILKDLFFAGGVEYFLALIVLDPADLRREAGTFANQIEDLKVQFIDTGSQVAE